MRSPLWLALGLGYVAAVTACVGDSANSGAAQGSKGGPCYGNQTCDPGLSCVNGTCFVSASDGGADSGADTSVPADAASSDATSDVQALACPYSRAANDQAACNGAHCSGGNCCVSMSAESCQTQCNAPDFSLGCDETADCTAKDAGAGHCGIVVQTNPAPQCPVVIQVLPGTSTNCNGAGLILCAADSDCKQGSTCVEAALTIGQQLTPHAAGVCYPFN